MDEPAREGLALELDGVDYNVFITRQLNTAIPPDDAYYGGPPPRQDETLYGVFIQACNRTDEDQRPDRLLQGHGQPAQRVQAESRCRADNPFAYRARELAPDECIPRGRQRRRSSARPRPRCCCSGCRSPRPRTGRSSSRSRVQGGREAHLRAGHLSAGRLRRSPAERLPQHQPRRRRRRLAPRPGADEQHGHRDPRSPHRRVGREPGVGVRAVVGRRLLVRASGPRVSSSSAVPVLPATLTPGTAAAVPVP